MPVEACRSRLPVGFPSPRPPTPIARLLARAGACACACIGAMLLSCSDETSITQPAGSDTPHPEAVAWDHPDGTTHCYLARTAGSGIDWPAAHDSATALGGYLVTLTSQEENDFVFTLIDSAAYWLARPNQIQAGPWIGGYQPPAAPEPDGYWLWISGEPLDYTNWTTGQPDERDLTNQNRMHFGETQGERVASWNDLSERSLLRGYVVEFSDSTAAHTVGLFLNAEGTYEGYTLFAPLQYYSTYLIDMQGRLVHEWSQSAFVPGNSVYLLAGGELLRTAAFDPAGVEPFRGGGAGGRVERFDWGGNLLWQFEYASDLHLSHHDVELLPNGNLLIIAWEYKTADEALATGRKPWLLTDGALWPDHIIEVEPTGSAGGTIVWEWHVWDHLIQDHDPTQESHGVVADHPELIDLNFTPEAHGSADWNHINAIDYNADLDQILLSVRQCSEVWIIDHSTTTAEAAGHEGGRGGRGGDLLYRWGNPQAYGAGNSNDQQLFVQHDAQWIADGLPGGGNVLVFNNGQGRPDGNYSSIVEITPPLQPDGGYAFEPGSAYGPVAPTWSYAADPPGDFYSGHISGAQRLPNGNTLICEGAHGIFFEVTGAGEMVWKYVNPVCSNGPLAQGETPPSIGNGYENVVFRAHRFSADSPALSGRDLTPGNPLER